MAGSTPVEDVLRELAERLLAQPHPYGAATVELFPGKMPPAQRGIDLLRPAGGRLLGGALYRRDKEVVQVEAVFDVPGSLQNVLGAYEKDLRNQGWAPGGPGGGGGGFVASGAMPWRSYRRGRSGPVLMVTPMQRGKGLTELRLRLDFEMARHMPPRPHPEGWDLMPSLLPPPGVEMEGGGGGGGDSHWSTQATASTKMPITELESYFAQQLTAAEWTRRSGASEEVVAWSLWDVAGHGDWKGLLMVVGSPDKDERVITLIIQRTSRPSRGWTQAISTWARR